MKKLWRSVRFLLIPLLCAVAVLILAKYVFFIGYVPTASMTPTISEESWILGSRIFGELRVGDIVIFEHEGKTLVKRVAAIGGDTVTQTDGKTLIVPKNSLYVLGDNKEQSIDSRYWEYPFIEKNNVLAILLMP